ncbi:MAG TPA: DJ-1/PfpI family protein [Candidatus Binatia bacterium]|nr:DJ-1/PfpI family protein [Candidatus Binatia bacterium]
MHLNRRTLFASAAAAGALTSSTADAQADSAPIEPLARPARGNIRVAFLVDRFHNIMDLAGSWEAFGSAGTDQQSFELYTVSPVRETLRLGGLQMLPDYTLDEAPQPHIVVMGAQSSRQGSDNNEAKSEWLRRIEPNADILMSVCTGAFVLARSGLIDGRLATTHHEYYEAFERDFPQVQLVRNRRFVDNGKFVSAGGLTSGIDGTLHVIARYFGADEAQRVAVYLEHYSDGWRTGVREVT